MESTKPCISCKKVKGLDEFYSNIYTSDGLRGDCKRCHLDKLKEKRKKGEFHVKFTQKEIKRLKALLKGQV